MASTSPPPETGNGEATNISSEESAPLVVLENNAEVQSTEVGEATNNADLYSVTPPTYTQSISEGERTVTAEQLKDDKLQDATQPAQPEPIGFASPRALSEHSGPPRPSTPLHVLQERARGNAPLAPTGHAPTLTHYFTEAASTVSLIGTRMCGILRDRPAIWLVRNNSVALSPLAAAVLVKEGLVDPRHLELLSQSPSARRDPTDPISAIMLGVYDYLNDVTLGLAAGPIELNRQATPLLAQPQSTQQRVFSDGAANTTQKRERDVLGSSEAAAQVGIETGKGMLRILTASLKTPVQLCNGVTRGFHNWPKVWGEEVREYENVTGLKSGLVVSAKSFGYGMGEGLLDLAVKPYQGAQRNGGVGFATGFAKGIGNAVCKTAAGACGLVGYTSVGIYKEIRNVKLADDDSCPADLVHKLGEVELVSATESDKLYVVRVWCQNMMPVRLA